MLLGALSSCGGTLQDPGPQPPDPDPSPATVPLVIEDVRVVGMVTETIQAHRTVVIQNGRITAIGDAATSHPAGAVVVQGRGRHLVPGLIDMHVHLNQADLTSYVRAGITSVRNMWGWPGLIPLTDRVHNGELWGPRIYSASQGLDNEPVQWPATIVVSSPAEAVAAVRASARRGGAGSRSIPVSAASPGSPS